MPYRFRNLPCSIQPESERWCIVGWYRDGTGGGVLEWCYDELDARRLLRQIQQDPTYVDCRVVAPDQMGQVYQETRAFFLNGPTPR